MKRYSDGNMGTPQKRSRGGPNDIDVKILIPSKVAGSIIGKGGKNISKLRSDFNSSVTVPDCPGPERILTVTAELDNALKVLEDVVPNLEDYVGGRGSGGEVDIRMLVHQSQAGCIIGKGGLKVKELREKTGARIKIYTNCCPQSTDRVVQITGRGQTCTDCIREIVELLKGAPVKGIDNPYDPHNYDDFYSDEYGGYGVGGGGGDRGGPPMMGNRGDMGPRGGGGGRFGGGPRGGDMPPRGSMGGAPPRGGYGGGGGYGGNGMGMNDMPPMGMGGGGPMGGSGPMSGGMDNGNGGGIGGACNSTQVTIPKDLAGAIIGKAGARIRKIRSDSGAGITIDEAPPNSNDRVITITGLPSQIQMAQYLLQQSVHENTSQGGGRY